MNFLDLRYFVALCEEMNFTRAAKKMIITQQSLSDHIAKMEKEYGVKLFDRQKPLTLTESGKTFLESAKKILNEEKDLNIRIQDIKDFRNGEITVGVPIARGTIILPPILTEFKKNLPYVHVNLLEGTTSEIYEALFKGKIDLLVSIQMDFPNKPDLKIIPLKKEKTYIVVPENIFNEKYTKVERQFLLKHPRVKLSAFAKCPFIIGYGWIDKIFTDCCRNENVEPIISIKSQSIETTVALCVEGYGATVLPSIFAGDKNPIIRASADKKVYRFELDSPEADRYVAIAYLGNKYQTRSAKEFIKITKRFFQDK